MLRAISSFLLVVALFAGGCVPPDLGVVLRFDRDDLSALVDEVRQIAEASDFVDVERPPRQGGDWEILLRMRAQKVVRREALTINVVRDRESVTVGVGRWGGLGAGLRPEEVEVIRALSNQLATLRGYVGIDREAGMTIDEEQRQPNKPVQSNSVDAPRKSGAVTAISRLPRSV